MSDPRCFNNFYVKIYPPVDWPYGREPERKEYLKIWEANKFNDCAIREQKPWWMFWKG
jgi:hypothetical protein